MQPEPARRPSPESGTDTPVAIIIFSRPETTARVFEAVRQARPAKLFIIADGPRSDVERLKCEAARKIVEAVDWPCDVQRNYAEKNMGINPRVSSGISWVFEHVDRAIILEDDCLPHPDFFRFASELLEKYVNDERVMHMGGTNFQQKNKDFSCPESYYFSVIPQIQGWATWRRAWKHYDAGMSAWPVARESDLLAKTFPDPAVRAHWQYKFDKQYENAPRMTWDGKWAFACVLHHGLSIVPKVNLISNIGYGPGATNTTSADDDRANMPVQGLQFPLVHPEAIAPNTQADAYEAKYIRGIDRSAWQRVVSFSKFNFPKTYNFAKKILNRV